MANVLKWTLPQQCKRDEKMENVKSIEQVIKYGALNVMHVIKILYFVH